MPALSLIIRNHKYYLWGKYRDKKKAYATAKKMRNQYRSRYFICAEEGFWFLQTSYYLYLDKPRRIW